MKEKLQVIIFAIAFFGLSITAWIKPADDVSESELRKLKQLPDISAEKIMSGDFMKDFESYTLDQFPFRDGFRRVKAVTYLYAMRQLDNNDIYVEDGYAVKMVYPYNRDAIEYAYGRFNNIYEKFIKGTEASCYYTVVPDKNYYLAGEHGALMLDYDELYDDMEKGMTFAEYIDVSKVLDKEDYYHTDTHWNQIHLQDVAETLADSMGVSIDSNYDMVTVEEPFYGVYYGQAALPMKPDRLRYLMNSSIAGARVFDWENNKEIKVYDETKLNTHSPYDLFLGGSLSLITIENARAETDKELVVFRDSFGSSIIPLLISGYRKITILDIRYIQSERVGMFVKFNNQDVLFLYNTEVLNNSSVLK